MKTRSHRTEFPDLNLNQEIIKLLHEIGFKDVSWHNDEMPSFTLDKPGKIFRVWIGEPGQNDEFESYCVEKYENPYDLEFADVHGLADVVIETNNPDELIEFLNSLKS
jgi:hypothetical protein